MKKLKLIIMLTILSIGFIPMTSQAKTLLNNNTIKITILHGNIHDIIQNTVLDDGTHLNDFSGTIEVENTTKNISFRNFSHYGDFFSYAAWIKRDGRDTLSLNPTLKTKWNWQHAMQGWSLISSSTHGLGWFPGFNYTSLKAQYVCHFRFATLKELWNLENDRPIVSDEKMFLTQCNP